ncbi:phage tail protein [Vibrio sp. OPT18]|uniref:phage tail protein n=1 Tax=Vibrio sp. OPT18 TaxID=2778641 RepID=UPI0018810D48|nr:phage tail protein [Vibrio sp. OPT18]MBE8578671.1 phage tail protein [Vibrio sp. OPT18]
MSLKLFVQGRRIPFFNTQLNFNLEQLAHTFEVSIEPMAITEPLSVEFTLSDLRIFKGSIDKVSSETQSQQYSMSLSGRSVSANMIDSTITMDARYGQTLDKLMNDIVKRFGLTVRNDMTANVLTPIDEFQINGESPLDNFAQLAKEQGCLIVERDGVLVLEKPAQGLVQGFYLELGKNIEGLSASRDFTKQFREVEVRGQWSEAHAVATNPAINSHRQCIIIADQLQDKAACLARANYEHDFGIAKSLEVSTTIPGLHSKLTGDAINRVISVTDEKQGIKEAMLIKSVSLSASDSSAQTSLTLCRPFAQVSHV